MNYRIKEICKEQGITLSELADKIEMKSANLSVSLSEKGNPTIATLTKIAVALNVDFIELFVPQREGITGYIEYEGEVRKINSVSDIEKILQEIKGK
jgi:transcriptional regulator with XRE-family HTH domain